MKLPLTMVIALAVFWSTAAIVLADGTVLGSMPSNVANDGKFIGQPGLELTANTTLTFTGSVWIGVDKSRTTVEVDIFNGNQGGLWNNHVTGNPVKVTYSLYADPLKTANPKALGTPVVFKTSDVMASNAWTPLYSGPVHPSARAPSGYYFYLLAVQWDNPSLAQTEFHAYKVQATGQVSIVSGQQVAFDGGPNNVSTGPNYVGPVDPPLGSSGNTYYGQWDWYVWVPPGSTSVTFNDCDADSAIDSDAPGNPPDDNPDPRFRIPPNIQYAIYYPNGQLLSLNLIPSGESECDAHTFSITQSGFYHWQWLGVDAHNTVFQSVQYETFSSPVTPYPANLASTPTATPTNSPVPSGGSSGSSPPSPATSTPIPPTVTPTRVATFTPSPTATPIRVPRLPATGGTGLPVVPLVALGAALLLLGFRARKRS